MTHESGQVIEGTFVTKAIDGQPYALLAPPDGDEISAGIASIFASMDESDIRTVDDEDDEAGDDVTYQLLGELNRLWLLAA